MRAAKDRQQPFDVGTSGRFVERNADRTRSEHAQIAVCFFGMFNQGAARFDFNPDCIEEIFMRNFQSERAKAISQWTGPAMNALGDCAQTARAMINRVHRCDHREKNLRRANVTGRFVATDVLLARLQSESVSGPAFSVVRNADKPAGHVAFVLIARCKIRCMRSAEAEWDSEPLRISNGNVRAEFAWRF